MANGFCGEVVEVHFLWRPQLDGISINQFVSIAVAEKLAMLQAQVYFAERSARADLDAFDQLMQRNSGAPPQTGDAT
jgi:hypothetical protein